MWLYTVAGVISYTDINLQLVRRSWWRSVNACGVPDPAAASILYYFGCMCPLPFRSRQGLQCVRASLGVLSICRASAVVSICPALCVRVRSRSVRRAVRSCCRLSVFRRAVLTCPGLIGSRRRCVSVNVRRSRRGLSAAGLPRVFDPAGAVWLPLISDPAGVRCPGFRRPAGVRCPMFDQTNNHPAGDHPAQKPKSPRCHFRKIKSH